MVGRPVKSKPRYGFGDGMRITNPTEKEWAKGSTTKSTDYGADTIKKYRIDKFKINTAAMRV